MLRRPARNAIIPAGHGARYVGRVLEDVWRRKRRGRFKIPACQTGRFVHGGHWCVKIIKIFVRNIVFYIIYIWEIHVHVPALLATMARRMLTAKAGLAAAPYPPVNALVVLVALDALVVLVALV